MVIGSSPIGSMRWILDAEVTVGTEYPFYATFFVPEAFVSDPSHVIAGRAADDAAVFEN